MPRAKSKKLKCYTCGVPLDPKTALWDEDALGKEAFCGVCHTEYLLPDVTDNTKPTAKQISEDKPEPKIKPWTCGICGEQFPENEGKKVVAHFKSHFDLAAGASI